jgi:tetratricopeptide (TPR) repeat protein
MRSITLALTFSLLLSSQTCCATEKDDLNLQMIEAERACRDWDNITATKLSTETLSRLKKDRTAQGFCLKGSAYRILGRTENTNSNYGKALKLFENSLNCYREGLEKFPSDGNLHLGMAKTLYRKADTLMNSGRLNDCKEVSEKAIDECDKALEFQNDNAEVILEKMRSFISWGGLSVLAKREQYRPDLNEKLAAKLEKDSLFKNDAPALLALQLMYLAQIQRDRDNALNSLNEAISELELISNPPRTLKNKYHLAQALIARGDIYKNRREYYTAIKDYDEAISISDSELVHDVTFAPHHQTKSEALAKKANILSVEKSYESASKIFQDSLLESENLLKQFPKNNNFNLRQGEIYYRYAIAISREPNFDANQVFSLFELSKQRFNVILKSNPQNLHANTQLAEELICEGKFLEKQGKKLLAKSRFKQALQRVERTYKLTRPSSERAILKGLALKKLGCLPEKDELFEVLQPQDAAIKNSIENIKKDLLYQERKKKRKKTEKAHNENSSGTSSAWDISTDTKATQDMLPTQLPTYILIPPDATSFTLVPERDFVDPVPGLLKEIDKLDKETE